MATSVSSSSSITLGEESKYGSRSKAATISKRSNRPAPTMTGTPKATLLLLSLHGSFQTKALELFEGIHVKIGRQTSAKSAPSASNGFFDSKVLSRTHAEVWCERSKVYIRDVKSSNGTFINGIRLSPEGEESASVELHNGDQVEFGIDIMNEDGSVLYHKVASKVTINMASATSSNPPSDSSAREQGGANNHAGNVEYLQKRLAKPSSTLSDAASEHSQYDSDSSVIRSLHNKDGINLDQLVQKLQTELQKASETGGELKILKSTVGNVERCMSKENLSQMTARIADLNKQLQQSKTQATAYLEKNRHQDQAILSAQREHSKLLTTIRKLQSENTRLQQDIRTMHDLKENGSVHGDRPQVQSLTPDEKNHSHQDEENRKLRQCIQSLEEAKKVSTKSISLLEAIQIPSVQLIIAILIPIASILQYFVFR
ncbi:hypothetical protein K450DRAFT_222415 [Umbelopsis ramanniana AG]|uniref:FHA domain-containing protein n=1 Tax=Umbelopsis ramanniana AG TaxID=1314678 RepID=A0AAD5HIW9_UMBRA|nr:uncharacterized protein K450DRAFT_222415 [Umbelopsis ramanniana AG]KAI8583713.1 hypothetical protein K450DRAFT_222415 [Umbelopsis ramanniana AG]